MNKSYFLCFYQRPGSCFYAAWRLWDENAQIFWKSSFFYKAKSFSKKVWVRSRVKKRTQTFMIGRTFKMIRTSTKFFVTFLSNWLKSQIPQFKKMIFATQNPIQKSFFWKRIKSSAKFKRASADFPTFSAPARILFFLYLLR